MATSEDQSQPIIFDAVEILFEGSTLIRFDALDDSSERSVEPRAAADGVDRPESPGRNEPRPRIDRYAVAAPSFHGGREGLLERFLRQIEVAHHANEGRQHAPGLGAVHLIHQRSHAVVRLGACSIHLPILS